MPWIWLGEKDYPDFQKNYFNISGMLDEEKEEYNYCVAEFTKKLTFEKEIEKIKLTVSADSFFMLCVNGSLEGIGPASAGGDFLLEKVPAPKHYANYYELEISGKEIELFARVRLLPEVLTDYSRGHGGFYLKCEAVFSDGESETSETDSSWLCRANYSYDGFRSYNGAIVSPEMKNARETGDIWCAETAPIPPLSLNRLEPENGVITVEAGGSASVTAELCRIYGAYPCLESSGKCRIKLETSELEGQEKRSERIYFAKADSYISFFMHSLSRAEMTVENLSDKPVTVRLSFIAPWYPVTRQGEVVTSDEGLNKVFDVCRHTLKICRQSLHLDSTKHQELLACTGDYYIESLMTLFCFGDMRLAELDLKRTADNLERLGGVMFHTTYSLIWVQMLHDVYMITGRKDNLIYCRNALEILLHRFESYIGENGVIDSPPDFMFVDWTVVDGFSMHHPPKALGQTVLNAFYYKALTDAAEIFAFLGDNEKSFSLKEKSVQFKKNFNEIFFDEEKQLYFDGLGDPYGGNKYYLPANINKKYFTKYPDILAALYGLADGDRAVNILERIIFNAEFQDIQPYFMHYLLCAVRKHGLFEKYGMKLLKRWIPLVNECEKGLAEGWIAPEENYSFDHSHAWGGTPAYQLPMALTGLEILEPGMKKLKFTPRLYGLEYARILIPTENGDILFTAEKGKNAVITAPDSIEIIVE